LSSPITVMKFGGTSLKDEHAFCRVASLVGAQHEYPVVVVSAMSGVTDALIGSLRIAAEQDVAKAIQSLEDHFERHLMVAANLGADARARTRLIVECARRKITEILNGVAIKHATNPCLQDSIASHGERLSANLLAIMLGEHGLPAFYVDARRCILTDQVHGNAQPLFPETLRQTRRELRSLIAKKRVPVLGGFIGATSNGVTTTMGRGSSDYSATIIAAALGASETQIWTDVDGVLTADPQLVKAARTIPQLSYAEATELARLGIRVLHPKMIQPVIEQRIPIRICNTHAPESNGTLIGNYSNASAGFVKAIAYTPDVTTIDITATLTFVANRFMRAIQQTFERHQSGFDIIGASEVGVSLACKEEGSFPHIVEDLARLGSVEIKRGHTVIGCIGIGLHESAGDARDVFCQLREVDPLLKWQSTSEVNLISTVPLASAGSLIRSLHHAFFE
jgi:aspartate kinase